MLAGHRIYQDTEEKPGKFLYSTTINLVVKPDYLLAEKQVIIPIEVKTGKTPPSPYQSHAMQLWAYCYLVEENFGIRPPYGYLRYPEKEFQIPYTDDAKQSVIEIVAEITQCKLSKKELHCRHQAHYLRKK